MNQPYFILVLAHSLHGRIRRFHIDQKLVIAVLGLALLGGFTLFGMVSSYLRMAWKVSHYNSLRQETEFLRERYKQLLTRSNETKEQVAQLQIFASEVSMAYGVKSAASGESSIDGIPEAQLTPTLHETLEEYNLLKSAKLSVFSRGYTRRWLTNVNPSIWPVNGRLMSHFGRRDDPFSGYQAFHSGVDISVPVGTPVRVTADGIVKMAEYFGAYGKLVVVDHGQGKSTYYAHLSRIDVIPGQEVRQGQVVAGSGATGRVTAPHLHYEVRYSGVPRNPYSHLAKSPLLPTNAAKLNFGF